MSLEYIRRYYGVPAEIGRRVCIEGRTGIIAEDRQSAYIYVLMDDDPPNKIMPYHPTSMVEYLNMGKVRKMTRSQKRYQDFLRVSDCYNGNFGAYLQDIQASRSIGD